MVIASDGLFDNLFDEEIADIVNALVRVRPAGELLDRHLCDVHLIVSGKC